MTTRDIAQLLGGTKRSFKPNSTLIHQGEVPRSGFFITKGIVKIYTLQINGEEQIAAFCGPGDFLPMSWLFGQTTSSMYYYETIDLCESVSVLRSDIDQAMQKSSQLRDYVLNKVIQNQTAYLMRITALEQSRAVDKILFTLYYLTFRFGKQSRQNEDDYYTVDIKLTHAMIASLVGLTRETTATEINKLKDKDVISYSKKIYTIHKSKLEKMMGEDSFSELFTAQSAT